MEQNPDLKKALNSRSQLPTHIQSVLFPTSQEYGVDIGQLIGTTIRFADGETGEIAECSIQDCGTSQLRGDWVEVMYNDGRELQIPLKEMNEILANRVM
jgi:hypothetical protein